ncbi:hypothetical protein DYB37_010105 [Aphanomyces astaci]|uniref:WRKY19-like zinc finger domain-containing protein n=1 Tax=Aphanomyces astaci TaxID=112090 RepID=A0A397FYK5_APHAT|nr:hypothetical protein DYB36_004162 [Aphanomyces astaci]RHY17314.1 hypothetical protein DYB25_003183 [Aphanomyces astaci]RHY40504.1 hypothetical protein DYB38_011809 [Aphanomyces astaci]RHY60322.1 hypothetical protein DYB34_002634 [Aphanomyces astaci]RHY64447.1 hypothetical protein DYB30_009002 [Aphanomyces astaci]
MNTDDNSFVKSFFVEEGANHAFSLTQHRSHTRPYGQNELSTFYVYATGLTHLTAHRFRDSLFNDHDLFSGYNIDDPLADVKQESGTHDGGMFEPLDHTHAPLTPLHKVDFASFPVFNDYELRVPQLASTPTSTFEPQYASFFHHNQYHPNAGAPPSSYSNHHHLHQSQYALPPHHHPVQIQPTSFQYQDPMGGLRASTTISTSPAIEVRKFPADPDFRTFQLANHVLPPPHHRSVSDFKPPQSMQKVPLQRATTAPNHQVVVPSYKSKGKRCTEGACTRRAQSNNRCKAHGGGARCQHPDCPKSSQGGGFCRAHGGGKKCEYDGCVKGQQRKGFCYAHGGIRKCKHAQCDKKDRGNGYCIAHGGGKRCTSDGCMNAVRKGRFCRAHMPTSNDD